MKLDPSKLTAHHHDVDWYYISDEYAELLRAYTLLAGGRIENDNCSEAIELPESDTYALYKNTDSTDNMQRVDIWQVYATVWEEYLE